jgi:hypothetical protein
MRIALLLVVALGAACGDDSAAGVVDGPCSDCDGGPGDARPQDAVRWRLGDRPPTRIYRFEDNLAVAAGRSTRVAVEHARTTCDVPAMTNVAVDDQARTVTITPRIFAQIPGGCAAAMTTRHVTLTLGAGTWTIGGGSAAPITLTVEPAPARACGVSPCSLDCDCDTAAGERCLGGQGLAGEFLACVTPCEYDRDCGGDGACVDLADGHFRACDAQPECTSMFPGPRGFGCTVDAACEPTFTLTAGTRHECSTDQDCDLGLRCVEATVAGGGVNRCEATCKSDAGWCQGAHICGPASADLGNLARTDSVCGFLGD